MAGSGIYTHGERPRFTKPMSVRLLDLCRRWTDDRCPCRVSLEDWARKRHQNASRGRPALSSTEAGHMTAFAPALPHLRLVDGPTGGRALGAPVTMSSFCGRCGAAPADERDSGRPRVCPACALGVILRTRSDVAPVLDGAFLVVDSSLSVQAVSARAEAVLAVRELHAINRHVLELLIPADS